MYSHFCRIFSFLKAIPSLIKCPTYILRIYLYLYTYKYMHAHFIYSILLRRFSSSESLLLSIHLSHPSRLVLHAAVALHLYCRDLFVPLHHGSVSTCNYRQTSIPYTI
uniref:Uncharacterized protein n=1 Tax=Schizaphis graminum TaxID=13262 RepID=A0A2S2NL92_SCHGA